MSDEKLFVDVVGPATPFNGLIWIDGRQCRKLWRSGTGSRPSEHSGRASVSIVGPLYHAAEIARLDYRPKAAEVRSRLCSHAKASSSASTQNRFHRHRQPPCQKPAAKPVEHDRQNCRWQSVRHPALGVSRSNFRNHETAGETVCGSGPADNFGNSRNFRRYRLVRPANTPASGSPPSDELGARPDRHRGRAFVAR